MFPPSGLSKILSMDITAMFEPADIAMPPPALPSPLTELSAIVT